MGATFEKVRPMPLPASVKHNPVTFDLEIGIGIGNIIEVAADDLGIGAGIQLLPYDLYLLAPEFVALGKFQRNRFRSLDHTIREPLLISSIFL